MGGKICLTLLITLAIAHQAVAQIRAYIQINSSDTIELVITDPLGRSTGVDPRLATENTIGFIDEITGANYADMSVGYLPPEGEEVTEDDIDVSREFIYTPRLPEESGMYRIQAIGLRLDEYSIHGGIDLMFDRSSVAWFNYKLTGITAPGHATEYLWQVSEDTSAMHIEKVVTASSIEQELGIMRELGWLAEADTFHLLNEPLQLAEAHLAHSDSAAARTALSALQTRLDGLQARLHEEAYSILKADVEGLLAALPEAVISLPAALTVDAENVRAQFNGSAFRIDGNNPDLAGAVSHFGAKHGLSAVSQAGYEALLEAVSPSQRGAISGSGEAEPDVAQTALEMSLETFVDRVLERSDVVVVDRRLSTNVGSEALPFVAYAPKGLVLAGRTKGVGILIVDGMLEMQGAATWRGLVVVRGGEGGAAPRIDLGGNAEVTGGIVLYGRNGETAALTLAGASVVRYSRAALDVLEDRLGL